MASEKQMKARQAFAVAAREVSKMNLKGKAKYDKLKELIRKHYHNK